MLKISYFIGEMKLSNFTGIYIYIPWHGDKNILDGKIMLLRKMPSIFKCVFVHSSVWKKSGKCLRK